MAPGHPALPAPAAPTRKIFDPWNSSSTGHQRADNNLSGSTSWRQSRTLKLRNQFAAGPGGGKRIFDTVGAGSPNFGQDGRKENGSWEKGAKSLREPGWRDIGTMIAKGSEEESNDQKEERLRQSQKFPETKLGVVDGEEIVGPKPQSKGIFYGLSFYINGSTAPMISDHKLKQLIAENGGKVSLGLARRSVSHVIVGRPNGRLGGAGGGLSGSKIEKEIQRVRGCGVKFVAVEWFIESLKAGKRLPEHQFSGVSTAPCGVKSVAGFFKNQEAKSSKASSSKAGVKLQQGG
ncbi:uncharacterized protein KY384_002446 [Bacidia gigantensis]|uniref:uncharacterized protein n=1 Tax=Bacidia gigantensis TaxID=2732470 RepID=UPI001D04C569|nr:uncharacterized protein KY384_002446 [Bacidia gigantensis]KAG8532569.1 hypothetical protein KY384_002446 [Bacidia gigantensis]